MRFSNAFLLIGLVFLSACSNRGSTVSNTDDTAADSSTSVAITERSDSKWMAAPTGLSRQFQESYPMLLDAVEQGEADSLVNLAFMSQGIARELMQKGNEKEAYQFFIQSGQALRTARAEGGDVPANSSVGQIFYNEACGLAKVGKVEEARSALADSIENGFNDLELLATDEDLEKVRQLDGFDAMLAEWQRVAAEKVKAHAREELEAGETFPFTFAATDVRGEEQSLDALKGKVVIVDVWGTWCPPCRAEIPSFIKLQEKYGDAGFQMIGLNYEGNMQEKEAQQTVIAFMEENDMNYPCIIGKEETRAQIPEFRGYPTTLFIDKTGTVRMKAVGLHEYEFLDAIVNELLSE